MNSSDSFPRFRDLIGSISRAGMGVLLLGAMLLSGTPVEAGGNQVASWMLANGVPYVAQASKNGDRGPTKVVRLDECDDGGKVTVPAGTRIEVWLPVASGVPYAWTPMPISGSAVVSAGPPRSLRVGPNVPGAPIFTVFTLDTVGLGGSELRFELRSLIHPTEAPAGTFSVRIRVTSTKGRGVRP